MLLPKGCVDPQVRRPEIVFDFVRRGVSKVGEGQTLAGRAVPVAACQYLPLLSSSWRLVLLEDSSKLGACRAAIGSQVELLLHRLGPPARN
jgi:hypothetical protein